MTKEQLQKMIDELENVPVFDFLPLYYILDHNSKCVMAVKHEDKYEMSGDYFAFYPKLGWLRWPANMNRQKPDEYPSSFDFTKDFKTALNHAVDHRELSDKPDSVQRERRADYPVY